MKDIALRIREAIVEECQERYWSLNEFCEANGFTSKEFFDLLDFGAQGYSDFLEQMEDRERGAY